MRKIILHIDFDSYFASVEQQDNPILRNKPLGVTAANGRTCIIASSREAKRLGIKTGARTYEALEICPDLELVSANFIKYFEVSKKFLKICQNFSPDVELFSIDEVFIDTTLTNHLFGGVYNIAQAIKSRIRDEIGEYITTSIGISCNKLLAKLASGINKPDGMFEITKNNLEAVYAKSKLTDMCGIGERVKLRLNKIGIYSPTQLKNFPINILKQEFGPAMAGFLKNVGFGIDSDSLSSFTSNPDVKSVGRNYCLPKNEYNKTVVLQNLFELCEEVGIKLRRLGKKARTIGISISGNFNIHGRKTYKEYFDRGKEIFTACLFLSNSHFSNSHLSSGSTKYVRQINVWVSSLEDAVNTPLSLFDSAKKNNLISAVDKINERFGDYTIRNGFLLYADKLTTVPNGYMADKSSTFFSRSIDSHSKQRGFEKVLDKYERTKLANESI